MIIKYMWIVLSVLMLSLEAKDVDVHLKAYFQDQPLSMVKLTGGLTGASNYKITANGREYVLRILDGKTSLKERKWEIDAASYAEKLGIAPAIYYVSPSYDAFIMEYIQGSSFSKENLSDTVKAIRTLHTSNAPFPQGQTVFEVIRSRFKTFPEGPIPSQTLNAALTKLEGLEQQFKGMLLVPSHNDLNALNIMTSPKGIKIIDWTAASMNYAYTDLGFFVLANLIPEDQYPELLLLYLGHCPSENEIKLLKIGKNVAILRVFSNIYFDLKPSEIPKPSHPLDHYVELHSKGLLNTKDLALALSLSALHSFLCSD